MAGTLKYADIVEQVTVEKEVDSVTGISSLVVLDPKQRPAAGKDVRPMVKLVDKKGRDLNIAGTDIPAHYFPPPGSVVSFADGAEAQVGDVLARIRQESSKTRDITGGLPPGGGSVRSTQTKGSGNSAEASGTAGFGKDTKGKQRLIITDSEGSSMKS